MAHGDLFGHRLSDHGLASAAALPGRARSQLVAACRGPKSSMGGGAEARMAPCGPSPCVGGLSDWESGPARRGPDDGGLRLEMRLLEGDAGAEAMEQWRNGQAAAVSEDGTMLAAGGWSAEAVSRRLRPVPCQVCVWNVEPDTFGDVKGGKRKAPADQAEPKFVLPGHSQVVTALSFGRKVGRLPWV